MDRAGRPAAKVAILHTCFVNYYNTGPGKALVTVLEINGGDVALAQKQARANVESLWRLAVGEHLTLLFENGQTVWY
jgi:Fe-S oxidoreductase